jgi:hypothetical protein
MLCKDAEYKNMDQDVSQGQLYDVQNEIKILYILISYNNWIQKRKK